MALFAISDLHLGFGADKKMDMFGDNWINHDKKISDNWKRMVGPEDTVIIGGDISWAMRLEGAVSDLSFIDGLPGKKVLHQGNHDYWWASTSRLNGMFESIFFLKNGFYSYGEYAICGSRGWVCPNDSRFLPHDEKIYKRELLRTNMSFDKAIKSGYNKFIMSLHFPPTNEKKEPSGFTELIEKYRPEYVVYGHLHGRPAFYSSLSGEVNGVIYRLVSADYLSFEPMKIMG